MKKLFNKNLILLFALLLNCTLVLVACNSVPPTNVHQPMSMRPPLATVPNMVNGSIYHAATTKPLFEDRRARNLGDTLTILLRETTTANTNTNATVNRNSSVSNSLTTLGKVPISVLRMFDAEYENSLAFSGNGSASNNNNFNGSITVTVIDVYPNGNLLVSGEKQVAVGNETQYVRVSGVVNPTFLSLDNSIESTKVADARIEYKGSGQSADATVMGWLARFFMAIMPF